MVSKEQLIKEIFLDERTSFQIYMDDECYIVKSCVYSKQGDIYEKHSNVKVLSRTSKNNTDIDKIIAYFTSMADGVKNKNIPIIQLDNTTDNNKIKLIHKIKNIFKRLC